MARILLGVSGGIAAYKALELARLATLAGHGVRVAMTENALRFVGAASFEGIVGAPVLTSEFERDPLGGAFPGDPRPAHDPIGHLEVVANCDAYLLAPASANTIAKLAAGIADSMPTTAFLACTAPRLVAPAMNDRMYGDAATQANLATLRERGVETIEPGEGAARLARRARQRPPAGPGRAAGAGRSDAAGGRAPLGRPAGAGHRRRHPRADRLGALPRQPLERPDGLRPRRRGAAPRRRRHPDRRQRHPARARGRAPHRRRDDGAAGRGDAREFAAAQLLLMAAAPADFRAAAPAEGKLKREGALELQLEPTEDILAGLAAERGEGQTIVGFAAEHGDDVARAREKLDAQGRRPDRPQRHLGPANRLRERRKRGNPDRAGRRNRAAARAEGRDRRADSRPPGRAGYTDLSFFVPIRVREVGLAHFFFVPNQA